MPASISSSNSTLVFQEPLPVDLPPRKLVPDVVRQSGVASVVEFNPREFNFGLFTAVCPPELVDRVINERGQGEQRCRRLPARLVVYATLFMCVSCLAYQKLLHHLAPFASGLSSTWQAPNKSSFGRARAKLGWEVMQGLFAALAVPLAQGDSAWACWRGRRLVAIDGTSLELSGELEADFGGAFRNGVRTGAPLMRVAGLVECGTRAPLAAECDRFEVSEKTLVERLLSSITPGMLVLADRHFLGVKLWKSCQARGADLLWRGSRSMGKNVIKTLPDGTYLTKITTAYRESVTVRVIEYRLAGPDAKDIVYRLFTNILDPQSGPALELARLYRERWEIETCFKELKAVQLRGELLRSRTKAGVLQEFWAHLVAYRISREIVYRVARTLPGQDPDQISFSSAQQIMLRSVATGVRVSAAALGRCLTRAINELGRARMLLTRRDRSSPRMVHHRQSHYLSRANTDGPRSARRDRLPGILVQQLPEA
jgi:Insertion element 4 transposase N-terminal/Transposase DDE domain